MEWLVLTLIGAFLIALADILQKNILKKEHTFEFTIIVYIAGCIFLIPFMTKLDFSKISYSLFGLISLRSIFASSGFLFLVKAYKHSEISTVSPLRNFSSVFLIFMSFFILHEKLSLLQYSGIFLIIFGGYFLQLENRYDLLHPFKQIITSKSTLYLIINFILWSLCSIIEKIIFNTSDIPVFNLLAISYPVSLTFLLIVYLIKYKNIENLIYSLKHYGLITTICSGLEFSSTAFHLMAVAIPISKVSLIMPIRRFATVLEVIIGGNLFHEKHLVHKSIATIIMLGGAFLILL